MSENKTENYFEDVIDEDQELADAYLNLGVIKYFPATISGTSDCINFLSSQPTEPWITR